jgi:hypothetical protein
MIQSVTIRGRTYEFKELHGKWLERKRTAARHREQFLPQVKINRKFAVAKQHLNVNTRTGRVIEVRTRNGIKQVTSDVLGQYVQTVLGKMGGQDYRPNFTAVDQYGAYSETISEEMNDAFLWAWDNEFMGDRKIQQLFLHLVIDGTVAIRCRYDRSVGDYVGDVPYKDGLPILDPKKAYDHVAKASEEGGQPANIKPLLEGKCVWDLLAYDNLLPPPGYDDDYNFPWDLIQRPVLVKDIKARYPELAKNVGPEKIESTATVTAGLGFADEEKAVLEDMAFVYTGYERPCMDYPQGQTVVFTESAVLDVIEGLPYADHPRGPRTGLHYFRWQKVPGRFAGRAFIEGGIGGQTIRNKRLTQIDTIIDRNLPKTYVEEGSVALPQTGEPNEYIQVRPGSPLPRNDAGVAPGAWLLQDVKLQDENVEKALGVRGISLGSPPQGVSAYSAMALLNENDSLKLDPISQSLRLEMVEVCWDTMESMRNWPRAKKILVAGSEDKLKEYLFESSKIPYSYLVTQQKGGSLPRTQASELQKVNDIWNASLATKAPLPLNWYVDSLEAGKPLPVPEDQADQDEHLAELENFMMISTGENPPVTKWQNHTIHVKAHTADLEKFMLAAAEGDTASEVIAEVLQRHIADHEAAEEAVAASQAVPGPTQAMAPGNPPLTSPQTDQAPPGAPQAPSAPTAPPPLAGLPGL